MRASLDSVAPNNPVTHQIWWGHGLAVNRKALEAAGLWDSSKDPVGGWYIRNASNKISGLQQNAQAPVWLAIDKAEPENLIKGLQSYARKQIVGGITTFNIWARGLMQKKPVKSYVQPIYPSAFV